MTSARGRWMISTSRSTTAIKLVTGTTGLFTGSPTFSGLSVAGCGTSLCCQGADLRRGSTPPCGEEREKATRGTSEERSSP